MSGDAVSLQERLLNLVALLLKSRAPVSKARILEEVDGYQDAPSKDARERTFDRDKLRLAELGIELRFVTDSFGQEGYRLDADESLLPPIALTAEERLILETLVRAKLSMAKGEFARQARAALFKLMFDNFEGADALAASSLAQVEHHPIEAGPADAAVVGSATHEVPHEQAKLDVLLDAVATRRTLQFEYTAVGGDAQSRTVDPWGLAFVHGAWYLAGYSHERQSERIFKVRRIGAKPKRKHKASRGQDFERPVNYDVADTVRRLLKPRDPAGQLDKVELEVAADVAFMVRGWAELDAHHNDDATFVTEPDSGGGVLTLYSPMERTVWHIYANYAPLIRIRSPKALRSSFAERLRTIRQRLGESAE